MYWGRVDAGLYLNYEMVRETYLCVLLCVLPLSRNLIIFPRLGGICNTSIQLCGGLAWLGWESEVGLSLSLSTAGLQNWRYLRDVSRWRATVRKSLVSVRLAQCCLQREMLHSSGEAEQRGSNSISCKPCSLNKTNKAQKSTGSITIECTIKEAGFDLLLS